MSRVKIGAVVVVVLAALTGAAFVVTSNKIAGNTSKDVETRVARAQTLLLASLTPLEDMDLARGAETLARESDILAALEAEPTARQRIGGPAIERYLGAAKSRRKPDWVAVVDATGAVAIKDSPLPGAEGWKQKFPAVHSALEGRKVVTDIWEYNGVVKVAVAPVIDENARTLGAVVQAFAISDTQAIAHAELLGAEVAYFHGDRLHASSFKTGGTQQLLGADPAIKALVADALAGKPRGIVPVKLGGETFLAAASKLPNHHNEGASAVVLSSVTKAQTASGTARLAILLLGGAGILIALLAMWITTRLIMHPVEEIELGVNEIINGDVDYTFKPVGDDFDGLASSLNVMLARLLGRPEPGEEPMDDDGGQSSTKVLLEEAVDMAALGGQQAAASDPETLALAQEPEADYYRRIYNEYMDGRRGLGEKVDNVSFEGFSAKLRLNEANLKKRYNCRAVRFRVQLKNEQVTLKPVPIF
jgi:hypothetical protein